MKKISLNGDWKITGKDEYGNLLTYTGTVPGTVHSDLIKQGMIENPLVSDNSKKCLWIEKHSWEYEKSFRLDEAGSKTYLKFAMLDVYCDVYLNGTKLGYCDNMFIPHSFDVSSLLKVGDNTVRVKFYPPDEVVSGKPERTAAFTRPRVYTRRIQCTYTWDWVDRFVTMGICGDTELLMPDITELEDVYIRTLSIDKFSAQISVSADFSAIGKDTFLRLEIASPDGDKVFSSRRLIVESNLTQLVDIENPALWYPNGYGDAKLYTVSVWAEDKDGNILSEKNIKYGLRKVKILQLEDKPGSEYFNKCLELREAEHITKSECTLDRNDSFRGFVVIVNDIPVMCKGANWVPSEPFVSDETPAGITDILELSAKAHMNLIRIWGGGIFESDHFYAECDRLGLMVCQDFLMACGDYPQEEEDFCNQLRLEAEFVTQKLRNNCCLIWWSGDNENGMWGNDNLELYDGRKAARAVIEPVVRKNDADRYFFPSSPYGGIPYGSVTCGTTHNTGYLGPVFNTFMHTDMKEYRKLFRKNLSRFSVEEPILGAASELSTLKFMSEDEFNDPEEKIWRHHTKNNPGGFKEFEIYDVIRQVSEKLYGECRNVCDKLCKMQYLQYDWVVITMELYRRNKGFSNGLLYWMLNDCWPAFGWAIIDYYKKPKAAWYGFRRSAKGIIASLDDENGRLKAYVCNDTVRDASGTLTVHKVTKDGASLVLTESFSSAANTSSVVCEFEADTLSAGCIYICDISYEGGRDRAMWLANRYSDTGITCAGVDIIAKTSGSITLRSKGYVHAVMLDGEDAVFDDNCFPMLPGEEITVAYTAKENAEIKVVTI